MQQLDTDLSSFRLAGELVGLVVPVVLLVFVVLVVNSPSKQDIFRKMVHVYCK